MISAALALLVFLVWSGPGPISVVNLILFASLLGILAETLLRRGNSPLAVVTAVGLIGLHRGVGLSLIGSTGAVGLVAGIAAAVAAAFLPAVRWTTALVPPAVAAVVGFSQHQQSPALAAPVHALTLFAGPIHPPPEAFWGESAGGLVCLAVMASAFAVGPVISFGLSWFLGFTLFLPDSPFVALAGLAIACIPWLDRGLGLLRPGRRRWLLAPAMSLLLAACGATTVPPGAVIVQPAGQSFDSAVSKNMTVRQWLELSINAYQSRRYLESAAAAQAAVRLQPDSAEAHNNVAAAYMALHLWDLGIQEAQEALRLNPHMTRALNNLVWMQEQKKLESRSR
ncbi:MAG TPA: hypothetical protein VNH18_32535 [Bryobacteraceae bacterium]|nr:hypothetical protein [Bryobacteraceae bacterium]